MTVSVTSVGSNHSVEIEDADVRIDFFSGTGAGGQHRNKKMNSVRMTHVPTGIVVTAQSRSREANLRDARAEIIKRIRDVKNTSLTSSVRDVKRSQIGSGMRGDKIRTYRFRDDQIEDHRTGKIIRCADLLRGGLSEMWK